MKDKSKVLKTYGYMFDKLQFIGLIGGRVCNPRQQQVLSIYLWSLCDYKQIIYNMLLPRVENPPPN